MISLKLCLQSQKYEPINPWRCTLILAVAFIPPRPQGLRAAEVRAGEGAGASAGILHPKFWGVNKLRPLNFNARNCFVLQNFLYLLPQDKVNFIYF
jgi:hypothetical protein